MKMEVRKGCSTIIMRLMRKQEQQKTSIKLLNGSGLTVSDEQEVIQEVERFWGKTVLHKWESDIRREKGDAWKGYV